MKEKRKKRIRIEIRISQKLKSKWQKEADEYSSTMTDFIISNVEKSMKFSEIKDIMKIADKIYTMDNIIGNNINQIAKDKNINGGMDEDLLYVFNRQMRNYEELLEERNDMVKKIYNLLITRMKREY